MQVCAKQAGHKPGAIQHPGLTAWIPAFAGMTTKKARAGCHPDSPFVIPAQAGIQWFRPDIPACLQAGMTIQGVVIAAQTGKSRSAYKQPGSALPGFLGGLFPTPLYHLHPCRRACAGMTKGATVRHGKRAVGMATSLFSLRCHSGEGRNPVVSTKHARLLAGGYDNSRRCYSGANRAKPECVQTARQRHSWIPRRLVPDLTATGRLAPDKGRRQAGNNPPGTTSFYTVFRPRRLARAFDLVFLSRGLRNCPV